MPARSTTSRRAGATAAVKSRARKAVGPKAIGRLEKSLDAADIALKDLRRELGRGGRGLVTDLDKTLKDSRKNLRSLSRTVVRDLEKLQKAATRGTSPRAKRSSGGTRSSATRSTTRKTAGSARKSASGAAKRTTRKASSTRSRATASRSGAKRK